MVKDECVWGVGGGGELESWSYSGRWNLRVHRCRNLSQKYTEVLFQPSAQLFHFRSVEISIHAGQSSC